MPGAGPRRKWALTTDERIMGKGVRVACAERRGAAVPRQPLPGEPMCSAAADVNADGRVDGSGG